LQGQFGLANIELLIRKRKLYMMVLSSWSWPYPSQFETGHHQNLNEEPTRMMNLHFWQQHMKY
jgi:hypothetical protein